MEICNYESTQCEEWNDFISHSKNGTFLFHRDYMDYHADRFCDSSLMVYDKGSKLVSVLPANKTGDVLTSHGGLTYGGFIADAKMTVPKMKEIFERALIYLTNQNFTKIVYKTMPHIYHRFPSEEDTYCLFTSNAKLCRRDVLSVIDYREPLKYQERRARSIKKAVHLQVRETQDYAQFWHILSRNLQQRYGLNPVHSLSEMQLLAQRFPDEIKLVASYHQDIMLAGAVLYLSSNVCHVQYNAASEDGKDAGALDVVLDYLVAEYSQRKRYFDFGVSTEQGGQYLNTGLVDYKESFGARTVTHDFYEIDLTGR